MWRILLTILLLTTSAHAVTVTLEKRGSGTANITGCGSVNRSCSYDLASGQTLSLTYSMDESNAALLGWGGLCAQWENQPTCSVVMDDTAARRFKGRYNIVAMLGYYQSGICRAALVGPYNYYYTRSLQEAVDAVRTGVAYNPIDCVAGPPPYLTMGAVTSNLILYGGFPSFTPNTYPNGTVSTIGGELIVTTGTLTIGQYGGIAIACGYTTVTGPLVITTPRTIGATECDFGLIVR